MTGPPLRIIRFIRAEVESLPGDRCRAVVQVERPESGLHTGTAEGGIAPGDALRAVARAAGDAVSDALGPGITIRVRGVQAVEAFGQTVVIVSVAAQAKGRNQTLLGVCDSGDNTPRAAALAILNATNRFLGAG